MMASLPKAILFGLLYGAPLSVLEGRTPSTLRWVPVKPSPAPSPAPRTVVYVASKDERKQRKKTKARLKKKRGY